LASELEGAREIDREPYASQIAEASFPLDGAARLSPVSVRDDEVGCFGLSLDPRNIEALRVIRREQDDGAVAAFPWDRALGSDCRIAT
jgi:hypothetical protein